MLWNAPWDRSKIYLVEEAHYKVSILDRKEWEDGFGPKHGIIWFIDDRKSKTVSQPAVAANGLRKSAYLDWTAATVCSRWKFSQSRYLRGYYWSVTSQEG